MTIHKIHILPGTLPGRYSAEHAGKIIIADSESVVIDAARELLASGADDHDTLRVAGPVSFADMPLWKLAGDYRPPRRSDVVRQARH